LLDDALTTNLVALAPRLALLDALVDESNLTRAAALVGVPQPTASHVERRALRSTALSSTHATPHQASVVCIQPVSAIPATQARSASTMAPPAGLWPR